MSQESLTDSTGNVTGYIETMPDGKQCLTDPQGTVLGYYEPTSDTTTDKFGTTLGQGNILTTLLR